MAAASFLANLLNLMDSEKASRLHVLALPTLVFCFFFSFFRLCLFLLDFSVPIDYQNFLHTLSYITYAPQRVSAALAVGGSPALSKQA